MDEVKQNLWVANPKLKILLLVFIFIFLFSGVGLVVFAQMQNSYRQQIYQDTVNSLPKHQTGTLENQKVGGSEISNWKTYKNDEYGFEFDYPSDLWASDNLKDFNKQGNSKIIVSLHNIESYNAALSCNCGEVQRFQIIVSPNDGSESSKAFFKAMNGSDAKIIKISGIDAVEAGEMDRAVFLIKNNVQYKISPVLEILSTFKFTK